MKRAYQVFGPEVLGKPRPTEWTKKASWASQMEYERAFGERIVKIGFIGAWGLNRIAAWKSARVPAQISVNSESQIRASTRKALRIAKRGLEGGNPRPVEKDIIAAVECLRSLSGIGLPTATAVIAICFSPNIPIIDRLAWRGLHRVSGKNDLSGLDYVEFLHFVLAASESLGLTAREIDIALMNEGRRLESAGVRGSEQATLAPRLAAFVEAHWDRGTSEFID